MGITPLEMYTMVPKSQEASGYKQAEHAHGQNQQNSIVNQINSEIVQNSMRPVQTNQPEKETYRYDAKEKGNSEYGGGAKKKKDDGKKKKDDTQQSFKKRGFDVRI